MKVWQMQMNTTYDRDIYPLTSLSKVEYLPVVRYNIPGSFCDYAPHSIMKEDAEKIPELFSNHSLKHWEDSPRLMPIWWRHILGCEMWRFSR